MFEIEWVFFGDSQASFAELACERLGQGVEKGVEVGYFIYLFLTNKKKDILIRAAKRVTHDIQDVYSYQQQTPPKAKATKQE